LKKPDPKAPIPLPDLRGPEHAEFAAAFWSNVAQAGPDECWPWTGRRLNKRTRTRLFDYGLSEFGGRRVYAHRLAFALSWGEVPRGADVLHACDNPPCANPQHLHRGDQALNMKEMSLRGRAPLIRHPAAAVDDMRRRRANGETYPEIAARYGASPHAVAKLVSGRSYRPRPDSRHLPPTVRPPVPVRQPIAERVSIEVADLLVRSGVTIKAVAAMFGVRRDSLGYTLRRARSLTFSRRGTSLRPAPAMSAHVAALVGDLASTTPLLVVPPGLALDGLIERIFGENSQN